MKNRLLALEKSVTHCRNKQTRGRKNPAAGSRQYPGAGRQARTLSVPVNYTVPGIVPALRQRDSMACWATVFTMLTSWKSDASFAIETALSAIGPKWLNLYTGNHGLSGTDKVEFVAAAGLIAEPPQNYSVQGWGNLLRTYGPLWVTTDEAPGRAWAIHARVITAINGDGTPAGTSFTIIDPASGRQYKERISVFVPKYEEEVRRTGYMRIQVLHWAQDARLSTGKSNSSSNVVAFQHNAYFGYPLGGKGHGNTAIVTPATPVSPVAPVDLDAVVAKLIADGADETALMTFLSEIKAPLKGGISTQSRLVLPSGVELNATLNLPTGVVLEGAEAFAFKAAVSSALLVVPVVGPTMTTLFSLLPEVANRLDVTIGVGPAVSGGIVGGGSLGAGILFAPGNKIGFYGSAGAILGAIASISATMQITVIKGEPSNFGGTAVLVGITVDTGVGPGIGAHAILSNGQFIGVTGEVGVTAGPSPFEAFSEFQYTATSMNLQRYAENLAAPVLFGIAGLTAVEAVNIGLAGASLLQPLAVSDGSLSFTSDQANRLLDTDARAKLGNKGKSSYSYPLLWVGEIKRGFADALFEVKWEGNDYGEIAGLRVVRNIHRTTTWSRSSLNITFKRVRTLPPPDMGDPREWPIVFEYDGSFDPYGNGQFTFQGQFAVNAFGGLKNIRHEVSDKSFISFVKMGEKTDYVRKKPDRSYTVPTIPEDQLSYLKEKLGI